MKLMLQTVFLTSLAFAPISAFGKVAVINQTIAEANPALCGHDHDDHADDALTHTTCTKDQVRSGIIAGCNGKGINIERAATMVPPPTDRVLALLGDSDTTTVSPKDADR